jgi:hypothetical protein
MSQRERLLKRRIPALQVSIRVDFSADADEAFAAHAAAERDLRSTRLRGLVDEARARVEELKAALAPFVEVLFVSPIPPVVYEQLILDHPPTIANREQGLIWNPATFAPALLAACVGQELPEGERMTEKDWTDWLSIAGAGVSGDLIRLFRTCLEVNGQVVR